MHKFHRVFNGNNVAGRSAIAKIDHRRQRGGFARPGAANHKHQPALVHDDFFENRRQAHFVKIGNLGRNGTDHHADKTLLHKNIHAKARQTRNRHGEIAFHFFGELRALRVIHQRMREGLSDLAGELLSGHRRHRAMRLHARWKIRRDK